MAKETTETASLWITRQDAMFIGFTLSHWMFPKNIGTYQVHRDEEGYHYHHTANMNYEVVPCEIDGKAHTQDGLPYYRIRRRLP